MKKRKINSVKTAPALTGAAILAADDLKLTRLEMPEWHGHVFIRPMTAGDRDRFDMMVMERRGKAKIRALITALCTVDAKGEPLFTLDDIDQLDKKAAAPIDRIFQKARLINKLFVEDVKAAEKN